MMLRTVTTRRRNSYGLHCCAVMATLLLLLSVSLLHSRLLTTDTPGLIERDVGDDPLTVDDTRLQDSNAYLKTASDDLIDEFEKSEYFEEDENVKIDQSTISSGYYFDHVSFVVRRAYDSRSVYDIQRWVDYETPFDSGFVLDDDKSKVVFGSDDMPVDEDLRRKLVKVNGIEDALLVKLGSDSPLRKGWGAWFDAKSDFLRKDRMFKSKFEVLNPVNHPLLQDPDGFSVTVLTRGDKLVQKGLALEMEKAPLIKKKPLSVSESNEANIDHLAQGLSSLDNTRRNSGNARQGFAVDRESEEKHSEHVTLNGDKLDELSSPVGKGVYDKSLKKKVEDNDFSVGKMRKEETQKATNFLADTKSEPQGFMHADGRRWGYFPGLDPSLSFSNFLDTFFRKSKCSMRVFMVWNSPPWMYTVRHQRGLESVLFHHPNACVVVFSETIELDFFKEFLKDGFNIAVTMPNLEELLKDTPTSIFASVWHEWRTTRFYSYHYSELIRLAALYKYGGIYLDCDIVVLKPISALRNTVGMDDATLGSRLNGAVMAFSKRSFFIMKCMSEFVSSYDDTLLRWNGADLLTRVAGNLSRKAKDIGKEQMLNVQPASILCPISSHNIQRFFTAPATDEEKASQDFLLRKILNESYTFHFWNSLTSALVPEPYSLVARILDKFCIRCFDLL